jgi:hypothetical protein
LVFSSTTAVAEEIYFEQCPQNLTIKQEIISSTVGGWERTNSENIHSLQGIYISFGDYTEKKTGYFKPTNEVKLANGDFLVFWDIAGGSKPDGFSFWATCRYKNTTAILTRKLPKNTNYCVARIYKNGIPFVEEMKCFDTPRNSSTEKPAE